MPAEKPCQEAFLRRAQAVIAVAWMAVVVPIAIGQAPAKSTSAQPLVVATESVKALAFEVVSVRQSRPGGVQDVGPTPDGFHMTTMPIAVAILAAYVPPTGGAAFYGPNEIQGFPDWAQSDRYDIEAKVSEADLAEWRKPTSQPAMMRAMLQALLADRFKLVTHGNTKEVPVYALVVGKNGPKFTVTNPTDPHPGGGKLPWGGVLVPEDAGQTYHFYGASMASLAPLLGGMAGRPVQDKTGLTGEYDFRLHKPAPIGAPVAGEEAADSGPTVFSAVEDLGLKLESAKGSVETLVIDHIERPSEN